MEKITKNLLQLQGRQTLRAFSDKCGIGQSTMHNYLHGRDMKASFIKQVCIKIGCDANWLLGLKKDGKKSGDAEVKLAMVRAYLEADIKEKHKLFKELGV